MNWRVKITLFLSRTWQKLLIQQKVTGRSKLVSHSVPSSYHSSQNLVKFATFFSLDSVVVFLAKNAPIKGTNVTLEEKKAKEAKAPKFDAQNDDPQGIYFILLLSIEVLIILVFFSN